MSRIRSISYLIVAFALLCTACSGQKATVPVEVSTLQSSPTEVKTAIPATPEPTAIPTQMPKPEPTRIEFKASDGTLLVGYYYPAPVQNAPVIVLMHMMGFTQSDWVKLGMVEWLQHWPSLQGRAGEFENSDSIYPPMPDGVHFAVFTFDFRGFGESVPLMPDQMNGDEFDKWMNGWLLDAAAAYAQAKLLPGVDTQRIAGIGASIGADAVVDECGEDCIGALSLSPGNFLNMNYSAAVKKLDDAGKPVWCIAHEKDGPSPEICKAAAGKYYKSIIYTEGGGQYGIHGMMFLAKNFAPPDIGQNLLGWLTVTFSLPK